MSAQSRVAGLDSTLAFVERLAPAAREELAATLSTIGATVQEQQRSLAPQITGNLRRAITWESVVERLRVRIGLLGLKSNGSAYYGRFVNFGRRSQTVLVQRRRRVNGALRTLNRRKRVSDIVSTYTLHVKARAAKPFIAIDAATNATADRSLADFWSRALTRAGGE
jgi:hypothetical protein